MGTAYWMLSNWIRSRVPVARATFSSVRVDGGVRPLSIRATADCVVFIRVGQLRLRQARARARLDQRTSHLVFRPQLFIRLAILRISAPPLVQFGKRAHYGTSPARRSANSISRRGVRRVFFTNTRTTTTLRCFAVTYSARAMPSRPLERISQSGPVRCLTCGASTRSRPTVAINSPM